MFDVSSIFYIATSVALGALIVNAIQALIVFYLTSRKAKQRQGEMREFLERIQAAADRREAEEPVKPVKRTARKKATTSA